MTPAKYRLLVLLCWSTCAPATVRYEVIDETSGGEKLSIEDVSTQANYSGP